MIPGTWVGVLPLVLGLFTAQPGLVGAMSTIAMQEQLIVRIPILPRAPMPQVEWREHKGPKCIATELLQRAIVSEPDDQVDFVLPNHVRLRA